MGKKWWPAVGLLKCYYMLLIIERGCSQLFPGTKILKKDSLVVGCSAVSGQVLENPNYLLPHDASCDYYHQNTSHTCFYDVYSLENHPYLAFLTVLQICIVKLIFSMITVTLALNTLHLLQESLSRIWLHAKMIFEYFGSARSRVWKCPERSNFFFP